MIEQFDAEGGLGVTTEVNFFAAACFPGHRTTQRVSLSESRTDQPGLWTLSEGKKTCRETAAVPPSLSGAAERF